MLYFSIHNIYGTNVPLIFVVPLSLSQNATIISVGDSIHDQIHGFAVNDGKELYFTSRNGDADNWLGLINLDGKYVGYPIIQQLGLSDDVAPKYITVIPGDHLQNFNLTKDEERTDKNITIKDGNPRLFWVELEYPYDGSIKIGYSEDLTYWERKEAGNTYLNGAILDSDKREIYILQVALEKHRIRKISLDNNLITTIHECDRTFHNLNYCQNIFKTCTNSECTIGYYAKENMLFWSVGSPNRFFSYNLSSTNLKEEPILRNVQPVSEFWALGQMKTVGDYMYIPVRNRGIYRYDLTKLDTPATLWFNVTSWSSTATIVAIEFNSDYSKIYFAINDKIYEHAFSSTPPTNTTSTLLGTASSVLGLAYEMKSNRLYYTDKYGSDADIGYISLNNNTKTRKLMQSFASLDPMKFVFVYQGYTSMETGSATSGSVTSGSVTSASVTSASGTSGSATTGSETSGSATSGSATTGSATTGSATTGSATTGSATTATTGSATTGSPTTGSETGEPSSAASLLLSLLLLILLISLF